MLQFNLLQLTAIVFLGKFTDLLFNLFAIRKKILDELLQFAVVKNISIANVA